MVTLTYFNNPDDPGCQQLMEELSPLQSSAEIKLVVIDSRTFPDFYDRFGCQAPVVTVGPYTLKSPLTMTEVRIAIGAAMDREKHLMKAGDETYKTRKERGQKVTRADMFSLWMTRHYMAFFNIVMLIYVGLPFLAPVFYKTGWEFPSKVIYTVYKPLCHQLAYRSWFLFGAQSAYPRELAHLEGLLSYEAVTGLEPSDLIAARKFLGTDFTGYKVALCERDVAIYGSILLFGIIFSLTGRRLKPLNFTLWLIIGIVPIALDGFSQMPGLMQGIDLSWLPVRESTPLLRTITGLLFGVTTAWYGYPYLEETMRDTRGLIAQKIAVTAQERREA